MSTNQLIAALMVAAVCGVAAPVFAQAPAAGAAAARAADAKAAATPAKSWVPKRTPDGQPDLQGYWQTQGTHTGKQERSLDLGNGKPGGDGFWAYGLGWGSDQQRRVQNTLPKGVIDPPDGTIPLQAWARTAKYDMVDNAEFPRSLSDVDPHARCIPSGVPRTNYALGYVGYQFQQVPGYVILYTELNHQTRIIPLDNRPPLGKDIRLFLGDSRGRWEGNTLTIVTRNQRVSKATGMGWLDMNGTPYSDQIEVEETFTLVDENTIAIQARVNDPEVARQPWTLAGTYIRAVEDWEVMEYACHEGNRAIENIRESIELRKKTGKK